MTAVSTASVGAIAVFVGCVACWIIGAILRATGITNPPSPETASEGIWLNIGVGIYGLAIAVCGYATLWILGHMTLDLIRYFRLGVLR